MVDAHVSFRPHVVYFSNSMSKLSSLQNSFFYLVNPRVAIAAPMPSDRVLATSRAFVIALS